MVDRHSSLGTRDQLNLPSLPVPTEAPSINTIYSCRGTYRETQIYLSTHNQIQVQIFNNTDSYFLIKYQGIYIKTIYRTPPIIAQCRSMVINANQNCGIDSNADQHRPFPINSSQI